MPKIAGRFRQEANEEMRHAERIIILGYAPNTSCLRSVKLNGSLEQLLQYAEDLAKEIVNFYAQAVSFCIKAQDCENRIFFEALLHEEKDHVAGIQSWRQELITGHEVNPA